MPTARSRKVFVNLPTADLPRAKAFFGTLGFAFNPQFGQAESYVAFGCAESPTTTPPA